MKLAYREQVVESAGRVEQNQSGAIDGEAGNMPRLPPRQGHKDNQPHDSQRRPTQVREAAERLPQLETPAREPRLRWFKRHLAKSPPQETRPPRLAAGES